MVIAGPIRGRCIGTGVLLLLLGWSHAAEGAVDYEGRIKPVLKERCYACHGALKQKSDLRLDTVAAIRRGGKGGPVLNLEKPEESALLERIEHTDLEERMPPEGKPLGAETIAEIRNWIAAGAPLMADEKADDDPRRHWAFQRIERPPVLKLDEANPIDAFLSVKRAENSLPLQAMAERSLLIRRLYLDLIGLPPNVEQLRDTRPWSDIVDELLESPQHGERWARHWMDVWRYSDWYGLGAQLRNSQKHIWHWRDWIIESLNADKGYDRMIHEMLAGDELAPEDLDTVRATGFLARNYYLFNRTSWLDNTIEHTGKAFLGLTMNCAKCHDHKYDPIEMTDYYRMRAIFEPHQVRLDELPGESDLKKNGLPRAFDDHLELETWLHKRGDPKNPDKAMPIAPGVPVLFEGFAPAIEEVDLPYVAYVPGARSHVQEGRLARAKKKVEEAREALREVPRTASKEPEKKSESEPVYLIEDQFDGPNEEQWEIAGSDWKYRDGVLVMTTANRKNELVRTKKPHPRNFEVSVRYRVTSGATYKSVGVRFDMINGGKDQNQVYTSAHVPESKVQVSHTVSGKDQYPPKGRIVRPVKVGETYELRYAVRDRLLNVWLNDEFMLAYELPRRHPKGLLALSGFDSVVEFDWLKLRELPIDFFLRSVGSKRDLSPEEAKKKLAEAERELQHVEAIVAVDRARATGAKEPSMEGKGEYKALRASMKALETPEHKFEQYPSTWPAKSTGRRTMLAKWITHRDNPLTARVAVNHIWMRHFGEPLVESVFDFGRRAKRPVHAELLDYLAVELIESGWSMKHLHRLMVSSQTYRLNSSNAGAGEARKIDPENHYYWRMNSRRMEAEVIRDSLLELAGELDGTMGGPSLNAAQEGKRRSLYFRHSRDDKSVFLSTFNGPDHLRCYRRSESVIPQQALALSNSGLALEMAKKIMERVRKEAPGLEAFIGRAFETIVCRVPSEEERVACREFCEKVRSATKASDLDSRVRLRFVHALLNYNDFVTIR